MALRSVSSLLSAGGQALWRANALAQVGATAVLPTSYAALDAELPGGGWPLGALCEILQASTGFAEWRFLLPALHTLDGALVLVGAPHEPFGPGLAAQELDVRQLLWVQAGSLSERLWAAEQALRCAGVAALLLWLPAGAPVQAEHLRRLHLGAQMHRQLLLVMRETNAQHSASPAVLRLLLEPGAQRDAVGLGLSVHILKRRGPPLMHPIELTPRPELLRDLLALSPLAAPDAFSSASIILSLHRSTGLRHATLDRHQAAA
jgi:protein ImuA